MHYKLITHSNRILLMSQVNEAISKGYEPLGGISIANDVEYNQSPNKHPRTLFAQAMVRKAPSPELASAKKQISEPTEMEA